LMTLITHKPTLFPYTTLFRSSRFSTHCFTYWRLESDAHHKDADVSLRQRNAAAWQTQRQFLSAPTRAAESCRRDVDCAEQERHRDRKSTRLNSSHQIISYAVF